MTFYGLHHRSAVLAASLALLTACDPSLFQAQDAGAGGAAAPDTGAGGAQPGGAQPGGAQTGGAQPGGAQTGGAQPGGAQPGGAQPGGAPVGGLPVGGSPVGGTPVGGAQPGGAQPGGTPVGGAPVGGVPVGGTPVGGAPVGGVPVGGAPIGGAPVGGVPVGGAPMGGAPAPECLGLGEPVSFTPGSTPCCANLFPLSCDAPGGDGACVYGCQAIYYCAQCGNGRCDVNENYCNCPFDCPAPPVECTPTGSPLPPPPALGECCEAGDNPLPNLQPDARGNCVQGEPALVCARSNDRFCGPGENFCNSPIDCPAPPPPCTEAGFVLESFRPGAACCAGLQPIGCEQTDADGVCRENCVGTVYCAACGDGQCDGAENPCNCPADCARVPDCVAEGMSVPVVREPPSCCPGTGGISCNRPTAQGTCDGPPLLGCGSVCAQCGDGQCGPGENTCNCPADCAPAQ